jgi:hypothetical protein
MLKGEELNGKVNNQTGGDTSGVVIVDAMIA